MSADPAGIGLSAGVTGVEDQAAALRRLVERLDDTTAALAGVRDAVAEGWDDAAGREWTARLELVRRAADRLAAHAATEATEVVERGPGAGDDAGEVTGAVGADIPGMRMPGLTGTRSTDRRGLVAPLLPPMEGAADR